MSRKSMTSRILVGFAVLLAAFAFTTPAQAQVVPEEGFVLYVDDVARDAAGEVTGTGELYIKNMESGSSRQITNLAGGAIINPQFTPVGDQVLFTWSSNPGVVDYEIYLVPVSVAAIVPADLAVYQVANLPAGSKQFAALSPDYDGDAGLLVFTRPTAAGGEEEILEYNFATEVVRRVANAATDVRLRHPVFLDATTIAYVQNADDGVNITIDVLTLDLSITPLVPTNITNNTGSANPELYGRLQSSQRSSGAQYLIFAKGIWSPIVLYRWDVYMITADGTVETQLTFTAADEYDGAFYGTTIGTDGWMFYGLVNDVTIANYDPDPTITNLFVEDVETGTTPGLISWAPLVSITPAEALATDVADTTLVDAASGQVHVRQFGQAPVQITSGTTVKSSPAIARDGGTVVYVDDDVNNQPKALWKINQDGTSNGLFWQGTAGNVEHVEKPSFSPDGRWVVFVLRNGPNQYSVVAKEISTGTGDAPTVIDDNGSNYYAEIDPPTFSPDMTRIVYAAREYLGAWDVYTTSVNVDNIAQTITPSTLTNLTDRTETEDRYPAYSNDGEKILFVSNIWDAQYQVFRMNVSPDTAGGPALELVGPATGLVSNLKYGPVFDPATNSDAVSWVDTDGSLQWSWLSRDADTLSAEVPALGITPNTLYGWGITRTPGTVIARRYLPEAFVAGIEFSYDIVVDVDEAAIPNSYTLTEVMSTPDVALTAVMEGGDPATVNTFPDVPTTGMTTYKILVSNNPALNGGVVDHVFRLTLQYDTPGDYVVTGNIKQSGASASSSRGNVYLQLTEPFMPVDTFTGDEETGADGVVDDFDLLYAIDCWKQDTQLPGFGTKWPLDIDNWNGIILAVIDIWANYDANGDVLLSTDGDDDVVNLGGTAQQAPGQYVFIGDLDAAPDGTLDTYGDGAGTGTDEMYWTQGEWDSL